MGKSDKTSGYVSLRVQVPLKMLNDFIGVIDKSGIEILESDLQLRGSVKKKHQKMHIFLTPEQKKTIASHQQRTTPIKMMLARKYNVSKTTVEKIWRDNPVKN